MKILILPGLDGTGALLYLVAALLAAKHEVTVVRYPLDATKYKDLKTIVEAALLSDDYIIVAESFSGPLAVMIASEDPMGLRGVAFVATFAKTPIRLPKFLTYLVDVVPTKSRLLSRLVQPLVMGKWATPEFTANFQKVMSAVPTSTLAGRLREILKVDVVQQLTEIQVPTIYLAAKSDRLVPPRMALEFDRSAHSVLEMDGPHFLLQAQAVASSEHIIDFAGRFA